MRLAWITDPHLNFVAERGVLVLCESVQASDPHSVLVGGDVAEAPSLAAYLRFLERQLQRPVYFVLGNHDFYRGSLARVRGVAASISQRSPWLRWLSESGVIQLTEHVALVGHDSWADGRLGAAAMSKVELNDYVLIEDFVGLDLPQRFGLLNRLGDEAAATLRPALVEACRRFDEVIVLTHVPPFRDACWHEGRISDDDYLPHFSCLVMGEMLREVAVAHSGTRITVLCGHTHGSGIVRVLPNLLVKTGGTVYGRPVVQEVLEFE